MFNFIADSVKLPSQLTALNTTIPFWWALIADLRNKVTVIIIAHQGQLLNDVDNLIVLKGVRLNLQGIPKRSISGR